MMQGGPSPEKQRNVHFNMVYTGFACFIGGTFIYGWNLTCVGLPGFYVKAFINQSLYDHYGVYDPPGESTLQKAIFSVVILMFPVGGLVGGLVSPTVSDKRGRKQAMFLNHTVGLIGSLFYASCKLANSFELMAVARLFVGFTSGASLAVVPVYAAEITPLAIRGAIGTCSQFFITVGMFCGTCFVLDDTLGSEEYWPVGMASMAIFISISFVMLLMPAAVESPKWLLVVRRDRAKAETALRKLYKRSNVDDLLADIEKESRMTSTGAVEKWTFAKLFKTKQLRWPVIITVCFGAARQMCGITCVSFYAATFYSAAGLDTKEASYAALAVTGIQLFAGMFSVTQMERFGRRALLLYPSVVMCLALAVLVTLLTLIDPNYFPDIDDPTRTILSWSAIVAVAIFVVAYSVGLGPIPIFIATELFKPGPRATAAGVAAITNLGSMFIVSLLFENVLDTYLKSFSFLPFMAISACFLVFFWIKLPETKKRPIDEIYRDLKCADEHYPTQTFEMKPVPYPE